MPSNKTYPQFVLLGDSIIQFGAFLRDGFSFTAGLEEHCQRRLDVINRGLSGYNTAMELLILPDQIPSPSCAKIDYLLILFGANDACLPSSTTGQHVPVAKYRENLRKILTHPSIAAHKPTILLVTPPPLHETHLLGDDLKKGYKEITRLQRVTAQYAGVVRELAAEYRERNVVLVDLWTALMNEATTLTTGYVPGGGYLGSLEKGYSKGLGDLLVDGLHLTGAGYKIFLKEVLPHVGKGWAEEAFDNPAWIFPHWSVAPKIE